MSLFQHTFDIPDKERCRAMIERDTSVMAYLKGLPSGQGAFGRTITKCLRRRLPDSKYCWQHKRIFDQLNDD